jgi:hypothetical protein
MGILLQSLGIEYRSKKHSYIPTLLDIDMWLISLMGFLTPWYNSTMKATRFVNITNFDLPKCFIHYFLNIWVSCMKFISFKLQQINNFFGILDFESLRFDLLLAKFPFSVRHLLHLFHLCHAFWKNNSKGSTNMIEIVHWLSSYGTSPKSNKP